MNPCKNCIVDVICIKKCPIFEIDLDRLQTDELIYTKRCMNNIKNETYQISENVEVDISFKSIRWFKDGNIHRDNDQPAIIWADGTIRWYKNNKLHRDSDQPAIIYYTGTRVWYKNGNRHRDNDQPAIIVYGGIRKWWRNGLEYEPM